MLKYLSILFLFTGAEFIFSCTVNPPVGKVPFYFAAGDSGTIIKYSKNELRIIKGLDSIFTCRVKETCFNGCVLVAREGRVLYKKAMGESDHKTKTLLNIN